MKKTILIQARLSSSRFPKKMLEKINNITLVEYVYNRCNESKKANKVVVITSDEESDDELYELCVNKNIAVFRGELNNVLKRYIDASIFFDVDVICRVCGDSPFVDVKAIDQMFDYYESNANIDYISTTNTLNGFMSEVFSSNLLNKVYNDDLSKEDKEHVTKYIRDNISKLNVKELDLKLKPKELEKFTLTIDYPEDMIVAKIIASNLEDFSFKSEDIINILKDTKEEI
ncbi:hypothetical protein [Sulfurimonas sp.]|uniref:cytidylyltransferase domain-containing protein n=1 Tax=Sulfurimonas sp. TaxID=2022749 RepID=UPI00261B1972|nr:hypothetical protein [Sulfurimonas sp.]MCW8895331.1 hypothetical protein [Sulfurimonas sp.]